MIRMKLLKRRFNYAKRALVAGDSFDVRDSDAKLLELAGIAKREGKAVATKKARKPAGTIKKAGEKKTARAKRAPSKRQYQRRDMQAEK